MVARLTFGEAEHARIREAIAEAESSTSGEIFAVFAQRSDSYFAVSAFAALGLSLVAGLLTALVAWGLGVALPAYVLEIAQAAGAGVLLVLLRLIEPLRMLFVPASVKASHAHRMALAQFMAHDLHATAARTGILVFVSEAEHHAEIVADSGIDAKVPQAEWDAIVEGLIAAARDDRIADGMAAAIRQSGRLLAVHFPSDGGGPNEIADRLVEI